jgi:capsular exopolysaccharide synthesis family protein
VSFVPERHFLEDSKSAFAESINHVRTGIAYSDVDNPPKTVLITSSVQGEGKTTLAFNLALSFASLGRTLLIDADLRKPRIEEITEASAQGGLVEYVAGLRSLQECVVQDPDCPSLYILKGGVVPPNPLELLSSQTLARTIAELRNKFSHIIIDTAPILPVSDAIVLGHLADSLLLVVEAERTTVRMARDALKRLGNAGIRTMGVVLAQVRVRSSAYYYDGKYQYYYGGYYRSPDDLSA